MIISYSTETEIGIVEASYVILMKTSCPPLPPKKTTTTTTVDVESIEKDFEIVLIELFIKIRKWLCIGLYKLSLQNENNFLDNISLLTNKLPGDFNMTIENKNLEAFMNSFGLECLIKKLTCFQSKNPSYIDLILTNKNDLFKNSVLDFGISDHLSFIITALKSQLVKGSTKTKLYRDHSEFNVANFKAELADKLESIEIFKIFSFKFIIIMHWQIKNCAFQ